MDGWMDGSTGTRVIVNAKPKH